MNKVITVLTFGYPNSLTPTLYTFVENIVVHWRNMGYTVKVVNPIPARKQKNHHIIGKHEDDIFPSYEDYLWMRKIPGLTRLQIHRMYKSIYKSVERCFDQKSDFIFTCFLNAGFIASRLSKKYGTKAFCECGESTLWSLNERSRRSSLRDLRHISGYVSVSKKNTHMLVDEQITSLEKIITIPNAVDLSIFYKRDKIEAREKLGLPKDITIGIFVGHFIDRKGPLRVEQATVDIPNLKMMYVGAGAQEPQGRNIVFKGSVKHEDLPKYLSAADFFVLPTLAEGCCNAIIEAMACGLPIISSNMAFNDDILDQETAILVDPKNIEELSNAINVMMQDIGLRKKMSSAAESKAKDFDIKIRAKKIIDYMEQ